MFLDISPRRILDGEIEALGCTTYTKHAGFVQAVSARH